MAQLETDINTAIAPSTIAITQSVTTSKITFTITGAETIDFLSEASGNVMAPALGILADSGVVATFTAQATPALAGDTMFYIHSTDIANNTTYLSSSTGGIIDVNGAFSIPINVAYKANQTYQATELDRQVYGRFGKSIKNINITLRANGGRLVTEMTDNHEIVLVVKVFWYAGE